MVKALGVMVILFANIVGYVFADICFNKAKELTTESNVKIICCFAFCVALMMFFSRKVEMENRFFSIWLKITAVLYVVIALGCLINILVSFA